MLKPLICSLLLLVTLPALVFTEDTFVEDFSGPVGPVGVGGAGGLPGGWKPLEFPGIQRHTVYSVESEAGNAFLKAVSRDSASGLFVELDVDLRRYPVLTWRWKVEGVLRSGDASTKKGDDYAARIYVTFAYDPSGATLFERMKHRLTKAVYGTAPSKAINYIWANRLPRGSHVPNPFSEKSMMVAVESGAGRTGGWVSERRNVYEDYKLLFGAEPPRVTAIAVMTDSDNTHGSAVAYYDDIKLESEE